MNLFRPSLTRNHKNMETLFDVTINRLSFSVAETADIILSMYETKVMKQMSERKKIKSSL